MALQRRAQLAKGWQQSMVNVAGLCEHRIEGRAAVAFRKDKAVTPIPFRPLGIVAHHFEVECHHQLDFRERPTGVATARRADHLDDVDAHIARDLLHLLHRDRR